MYVPFNNNAYCKTGSTENGQKGYTLTEVVIVLVIAGILTVYLSRAIETRQAGVSSEVQTLYKTMQAARAKAVNGQYNVRMEFDGSKRVRIVSELNSAQEVTGPWLNLNHIAIHKGETKIYSPANVPTGADTIVWGKNGEMPAVAAATNNTAVGVELLKKRYYPIFDVSVDEPEFLTFIRVHGTGIVDMVKDVVVAHPPKPSKNPPDFTPVP